MIARLLSVMLVAFVQAASTYEYSGGSINSAVSDGGYEMGGGYGSGEGGDTGGSASYGHSFDAAIHSRRSVSVVPVHEQYEAPKINTVSVEAAETPLVLNLKSKSSALIVNAVHIGAEHGSMKKTSSVDEPHVRIHTANRPILHEIREIVQPHRKIIQYIHPMKQKISTFVSSGGKGGGYRGGNHGGNYHGGGYSGGHSGYGPKKYEPNLDFGSSGLEFGHGDQGGKYGGGMSGSNLPMVPYGGHGGGHADMATAASGMWGNSIGDLDGAYSFIRNSRKPAYPKRARWY